ncbi:sporulation histidine kinase inhibitor Sda [Cohnella thermotolerans]|nr:sporulation histidine kinase inhibitor Sda [Cohnella thermotolerans]
MLVLLSDEMLLEAYHHALRMQLDRDFIYLLRTEIVRRNLVLPDEQAG